MGQPEPTLESVYIATSDPGFAERHMTNLAHS
jgi:hypothetical protein